jgi:hypothetical protein
MKLLRYFLETKKSWYEKKVREESIDYLKLKIA